MPDRINALTPEALVMMDTIARTGSFAAAARELGKVPSALTYSVRQLEEALDVLLFDRSSRQAQLTAAGTELLHEGRRLLQEMDAVSNRVRRVAKGWEAQLAISVEDILSQPTMFDLVQDFCAICDGSAAEGAVPANGTRLRLRTDVLTGTWEALVRARWTWPSACRLSTPTRVASNCARWVRCRSSTAWRHTTLWLMPASR